MRKPVVHHLVVVDDDVVIRDALADALADKRRTCLSIIIIPASIPTLFAFALITPAWTRTAVAAADADQQAVEDPFFDSGYGFLTIN